MSHSKPNLALWFAICDAAARRAKQHGYKWWESPACGNPAFFTVEAARAHICMEMDTAGMVTTLIHVGESHGYACHVSQINISALESFIDHMGPSPEDYKCLS